MPKLGSGRGIVVGIASGLLAACGGGGGGGQPTPPPPTPTFTVAGAVSGLAGSGLVLQLNGANNLAVAANGAFSFPSGIPSGSTYNVTVLTQPTTPSQACTVASGSGTITSNVTNVAVTCVTGAFTVGGTVSGLATGALGLVVTNNGGDNKAIGTNGAFTFDTPVSSGGTYDIRVLSPPWDPYQACTVANGAGTVTNATITAPTITCATLVPKFATSLDFNGSSYSQYAVDTNTGQLRPRGFAHVGANPVDVTAYGAAAKISFVLSRGSATLHAFARDEVTGRITEAPNSPRTTGAIASPGAVTTTGAATLTLHPTLPFIYVANGGGASTIAGFSFDTTSGALTAITGSPFASGARPVKLAIEPNGRYAYVVNRDDETVTSYSIDQTTGALTAIGAATPTGATGATFPVVHLSGKYIYVPNGSGSISAYSIGANGALTALANSPFALAANLVAPILLHPSGKFLYIKTSPPGDVGSLLAVAIDQGTGALSMVGSPATLGFSPTGTTFDPAGRYLLVANRGAQPWTANTQGSLSLFRIDQTTGALTELLGENLMPPPYSVGFDGTGNYLYSASAEGNLVRVWRFDYTTGVITQPALSTSMVRGAPVTLLTIPAFNAAAARFSSKFLYVPNSGDSTISAYSSDATTGVLTATTGVGPSPVIQNVEAVAVVPGALRVLAMNASGTQSVRTFPINAQSGALGASSTDASPGTAPSALVAEPSGRFAYAADNATNLVRAFSINRTNGNVTALVSTSPVVDDVRGLAVHPNGRYLYYITDTRWGLKEIDSEDGALTTVVDNATTSGTKTAIALHPSGRYAYIARATGAIDTYDVTSTTGQLGSMFSTSSRGTDPVSIAVDPKGIYLYVANSSSGNIATFRIANGQPVATIDPVTNVLNPRSIRVSYDGRYLYAVLGGSQVLTFAINRTTGTLSAPSMGPATGGGPRELALSEDVE